MNDPGLPIPEADELSVAWGTDKRLIIVSGVTTRPMVAEALRAIAEAYDRSEVNA